MCGGYRIQWHNVGKIRRLIFYYWSLAIISNSFLAYPKAPIKRFMSDQSLKFFEACAQVVVFHVHSPWILEGNSDVQYPQLFLCSSMTLTPA